MQPLARVKHSPPLAHDSKHGAGEHAGEHANAGEPPLSSVQQLYLYQYQQNKKAEIRAATNKRVRRRPPPSYYYYYTARTAAAGAGPLLLLLLLLVPAAELASHPCCPVGRVHSGVRQPSG